MTKMQQLRLFELREYAEEQRRALGYGYLGYNKEETDKWTNVLAWIILIEKGE